MWCEAIAAVLRLEPKDVVSEATLRVRLALGGARTPREGVLGD